MTPTEGLQLLNDPMIGPMIRQLLANGAKGFGGFSGNQGGGVQKSLGDVFKVT